MFTSPRRPARPRAIAGSAAVTVVAALLVPAATGVAAAAASSPLVGSPRGDAAVARFAAGRAAGSELSTSVTAVHRRLGAAKGPVTLVLELDRGSAGSAFAGARARGAAAASTASREQVSAVEAQQRQVAVAFTRPATEATELYAVHNVLNAIYVSTDASRVDALARVAGVKSVHVAVPKTRGNATVVPLTGAPKVWGNGTAGSGTGKGVRIGVIDTGIDYLHANFGGPGTPAAYAAQNDTDPNDTPAYFGQNAVKVKGGYDFVGDGYDATSTDDAYNPVPHPDADPLDCASNLGGGHGSHVAGSAAGFGVTNGTTYGLTGTGAARAIDPSKYTAATDFSQFGALGADGQPGIGPGTAPGASLYALRVFGCTGSTNFVTAAIDFAADPNQDGDVSDHLDVVNMSLGSNGAPEDDIDDVATDNLSALGTTVVVAAGNAGDNHYEVGSPGAALSAVTVAASDDSTAVTDAVSTTIGAASPTKLAAENSIAFDYKGAGQDFSGTLARVTGKGADATATGADNSDGCDPFSDAQKAAVAGKYAVLEWTDLGTRRCGSVKRSGNAAAAGATGSLFLSDAVPFSAGITGSATIPVALVSKGTANQAGGDQIRAALVAGTPVTATIGYSLRNAGKIVLSGAADPTDSIAAFTSRGGAYGATSKPDLAAPGVSIFSTSSGTGTEGQNDSGTSMATPHTAGIAALIKAAHPTYGSAQVKAALMNTAGQDLFASPGKTGAKYGVSRVGAGRVQADRAVTTSVLAYSTDTPAGVTASFGNVAVPSAAVQTLTKTVTVANLGTTPQIYDVAYSARSAVAGAPVAVSPATVTVPAGSPTAPGTATVTVTLTLTRSALRHDLDATEQRTQLGAPRQYLSEVTGLLTLSQGTGATAEKLRVPVYAAPRPASTVAAASPKLTIAKPTTGTTSTTPLPLGGSGVNNPSTGTATTPNGVTSVTSGYELAAVSPALALCSAAGPGASGHCLRQPSQAEADLKAVGVASTFVPATSATTTPPAPARPADRLLGFAINVQRPWKTPVDLAPFEVDIDTTGDGVPDFYVLNTRAPAGTDGTDLFVADTFAIGAGPDGSDKMVDTEPLNGTDGATDTDVFNSDAIVLPVLASALGLTGDGRFTYQVVSGDVFNDFASGVLDAVGPLSFAGLQPGLGLASDGTGNPLVPDSGATLQVAYDGATFGGDSPLGLLLVHHHNTDGLRAETVPLTNSTSTSLTSDAAPVAPIGQPITLRAAVAKTDPSSQAGLGVSSATVTFRDGGTVLAAVPLAGSSTTDYTVDAPSNGAHSYTATYDGNATYLASSSAPLATTVAAVPTATTLATTGSPSAAGAPVALTATVVQSGDPVTPELLAGTVTFADGGAPLGSAPIRTDPKTGVGTAVVTAGALAVGPHTLSATYAGTPTFAGSASSLLTQAVVINASTTTLVPSAGTHTAGAPLPVAVAVASPGGTPTGTVTVTVDGLAPQPAPLTSGAAALALTGLTAGRHTLVATYAGSATTAMSASAPVYVDVLAAPVPPAAAISAISVVTVSGPATVRAGPRGSRYAIKLAPSLPSTAAGGRRVGLYVDGVRRATLLTSPTGSTGYYVSFRKGVHKVSAVFFGAPDLSKSVSKDLRVRAS